MASTVTRLFTDTARLEFRGGMHSSPPGFLEVAPGASFLTACTFKVREPSDPQAGKLEHLVSHTRYLAKIDDNIFAA